MKQMSKSFLSVMLLFLGVALLLSGCSSDEDNINNQGDDTITDTTDNVDNSNTEGDGVSADEAGETVTEDLVGDAEEEVDVGDLI